jgi:hypothetical protein
VDWNLLCSKESQMAKGIVPRWFLAALCVAGFQPAIRGRDALDTSAASPIPLTAKAEEIKLAGIWSFQLDREDRGEAQQWFERELSDVIVLPGVLTAQGYGDPVSMQTKWTGNINRIWTSDPYYKQYQTPGNFKMPFWLQPDRHYAGAAWYQRQVEVPPEWQGKRLTLFLERPHWKTTVWLDSRCLGSKDSLGTAHVYELGREVAPGQHRLTIRVDNRMIVDVGNNAHSVSDHTQGNWNGLAGRIELQASDPVWIDDVRVYPSIKDRTVKVKVSIGNLTGASGTGVLTVRVAPSWRGRPALASRGHPFGSAQGGLGLASPSPDATTGPAIQGQDALATKEQGRDALATTGVSQAGQPLSVPVSWTAQGGSVEYIYAMRDDCQLWDEFRPNLYTMTIELRGNTGGIAKPALSRPNGAEGLVRSVPVRASKERVEGVPPSNRGQDARDTTPDGVTTNRLDDAAPSDQTTIQFGMREVGTQGTRIAINGRPIFLRGTLECCIFPLTGHPPTDVDSWKRIIRICKAHGLNHIRFHSWCPPEAAFVAADELGFYYHVECSAWATVGDGRGEGVPPLQPGVKSKAKPALSEAEGMASPPFDEWLYQESEAMVKAYGNHPSFTFMAYGNEPAGKNQNQFLGDFVSYWKKRDPRRLYTSGAGWPMLPVNDYYSTPVPRIQQWGQGVQSRVNAKPPETMTDYRDFVEQHKNAPVVSHEIGQWCVYPDLDEMTKYTGLLKAKNFEIFQDQLERNGMLHQAQAFLMASGKLQALLYKEDIESALRTPGFGGFQLLDLHDFPGQGTALVGVLDPFWDSKGYITAQQYRRFAGPMVPLARLERRIFEWGDVVQARIELAQFGPADLENVTPLWEIRGPGGIVAQGVLAKQTIKAGTLSLLGEIRAKLPESAKAQKLSLEVTIHDTEAANDWDLWVFPKAVSWRGRPALASRGHPFGSAQGGPGLASLTPTGAEGQGQDALATPAADILVTRELNEAAVDRLNQGGKVLFLPPAQAIRNDKRHPITMGFSSIFWNTVWTDWQPPHTLGILCDPNHPALEQFPTEYHSNWQWWELIHGAAPFILTSHRNLQPVVQVIDDWVTARKLALVFEARVGSGKLLACGCDIVTDLDQRPVARQMRHSLLAYMAGTLFDPKYNMTVPQLSDLLKEPSPLQKLGATASASNHHPGYGPELAIDGNPATIWHTNWEPMAQPPHTLILDLKKPVRLRGLTYLPRQDMTNGRIARFEVYLSLDEKEWGQSVATGTWANNATLKTVRFEKSQDARFVKLIALSEVRGQPFASAAEVDILVE